MKSKKPTRLQLASVATRKTILKAVLKAGFTTIKISALMVLTRCGINCVGTHLRALSAEKLIECNNTGGNHCAWGPPGTWNHFAPLRAATKRGRERQRERRAEKLEALLHQPKVRPANSIWEEAARCLL